MKGLFLLFVIIYLISSYIKKAAKKAEQRRREEIGPHAPPERGSMRSVEDKASFREENTDGIKNFTSPGNAGAVLEKKEERLPRAAAPQSPPTLQELIFGSFRPEEPKIKLLKQARKKLKSNIPKSRPVKEQIEKKKKIAEKPFIATPQPVGSLKKKMQRLSSRSLKEGILLSEIIGPCLAHRQESSRQF